MDYSSIKNETLLLINDILNLSNKELILKLVQNNLLNFISILLTHYSCWKEEQYISFCEFILYLVDIQFDGLIEYLNQDTNFLDFLDEAFNSNDERLITHTNEIFSILENPD